MLNKLQSIPIVFKGIMLGFLTILSLRVMTPITNYILALYETGTMMYYSAVLSYYLILIFVTWFLIWIILFQANKEDVKNG